MPMTKAALFWTNKRLEAVSRTLLTLFQALVIGGTLGGVFGKIPSFKLKTLFILVTLACLCIGVVFSDWPMKKEA